MTFSRQVFGVLDTQQRNLKVCSEDLVFDSNYARDEFEEGIFVGEDLV